MLRRQGNNYFAAALPRPELNVFSNLLEAIRLCLDQLGYLIRVLRYAEVLIPRPIAVIKVGIILTGFSNFPDKLRGTSNKTPDDRIPAFIGRV